MWSLPHPGRAALDAYRACVSSVADVGLRDRYQSIEGAIVMSSDAYAVGATAVELHLIPAQGSVEGVVSRAEMSKLYSGQMAKKGRPGRAIYDEIMSAPPQGRCPLCGQRIVSTLDHHLPKSGYPTLAVAPLNLVPSCADCNKAKLDLAPTSAQDEPFHPYFDEVDSELWLHADVVEVAPPALVFSVLSPSAWSETLVARVQRQFSVLRLGALYGSHAASELVNIRWQLGNLLESGGAASVRGHLSQVADSHAAARNNSWQIAAYRALAASEWYCGGGFGGQ